MEQRFACLLLAGHKHFGYRIGNPILQSEQVLHIAIVFRRLQGPRVAGPVHVHQHPDFVAHFLNGSFHHQVDVQVPGHLRPFCVCALIPSHARHGPDQQLAGRKQAMHHGVRECDGKELIFFARVPQLKRNHGDRRAVRVDANRSLIVRG